jgi:hypothetical protein
MDDENPTDAPLESLLADPRSTGVSIGVSIGRQTCRR